LKNQYQLTGSQSSYVFLNDANEPLYDIKRIRDNQWKKTLKECKFDYRPIYHTRHTFATVMLENGEDILWVSNMLGHTDSTMTLSRYARYIKREHKQRGQFLKKELTPNGTEFDTELLNIA
jgi:integrase